MDKLNQIFIDSLKTGFVDKTISSDVAYRPELLVNNKKPVKKILTSILEELENSTQFFISVAFVTTSGVATIIESLKILAAQDIKGQILVSQYLNFTQPEALRKLAKFKNIELKIATTGNAHAKGYIFKKKDNYSLIVGSSNLTASALTTNKEWNLKVSALAESALVERVLAEFHIDFANATPVTTAYIDFYEGIYQKQFLFNKNNRLENLAATGAKITPNAMQLEALENLSNLRAEKKQKALIISATGTGKTYLAAFDAKNFNPKKLLFVVHRLTIAKAALNTFKSIFGAHKSMGIYSGQQKELNHDFIFSTIQTISKPTSLQEFAKNEFDYIIIDEAHRSEAASYQQLISYFKPLFLLGMTATPERSDGMDIFQLFDHNIAYEIRLNKAMEEEMISSFHYYGLADLSIDNQEIANKTQFNRLISSERVDRIIEQATFYGTDNGITRGLIFCSNVNEAAELSILFNRKGLKTVALTADSSDIERTKAIEQIESDNLAEKLDYIFTVDILNEGIDIPKINQIIMLRPTTSAIIFIQQLGRGLRKIEEKNYLTVIDFIGNYEHNYLIPIALYGDSSYNKDSLRKLMSDGSRMISGSSTINFDQISKEKIFQSIDAANMQLFADLKKDFLFLKKKLGHYPMMMDFVKYGARDPFSYVSYANSYYNFIQKIESDENLTLSAKQVKLLVLFSKEINNSKRLEEPLILKLLITKGELSINDFINYIFEKYKYTVTQATIISAVANLNFEFYRENKNGALLSAREIYGLDIIKIVHNNFEFAHDFKQHLGQDIFKKFLLDSTDYALYQFDNLFEPNHWEDGFVLYRKYSRKDVFRILNVAENPVAQNVGGYLVSADNKHCPIFVNYHKAEDIAASIKYEDKFINNKEFQWMSKSNRKIDSKDVQAILGRNGEIRLPLFIKKNNDEGLEFYYMGNLKPNLEKVEETKMADDKGKEISVVKIRFNLQTPVVANIYNYLHGQEKNKKLAIEPAEITNASPNNLVFEPAKNQRIPFYDFYAAAGTFSEMQSEKNFTLIDCPENITQAEDYFACKIIGESMNRSIPNGSICLFRKYTGGSRNGKIVLVENRDLQDQDFNSAFTIKTYSSQKTITDDSWSHNAIILLPNSYDKNYQPIVIGAQEAKSMRVVGEFVRILY
jgi:superfamily II DNA or RNA helicase/HKD family nuclease/SOS-response transcriptional repressor LexA